MVLSILIAAFAVCGVFLILWTILEAVIFPIPRKDTVLIVPVAGDASRTQQTIRGCLRLRNHRGVGERLIFVDQGLDQEAQIAAQMLLRREPYAVLCAASQVPEMIRWENEELGAGTD